MKKIVSIAMAAAAIMLSACSNDDDNVMDNNTPKTGMVLHATIEGQNASTRATMTGNGESLTAENGDWTFSFDNQDNINVSNDAVSGYYSFSKTGDNFVSTNAKATKTPANWCAYFPSNDVDFANQSGKFKEVANKYALAGTTDNASTGADGISIQMKPQVAVLRVVKVENQKFGACDVNVRTADGKYVAGLTARNGEAKFDVKTSDKKVTFLSQTTPGVYYIAVPAGVKISIYNGDSLRNTTKDAGLTAGKYYTITTAPTKGKLTAIIDGKKVEKEWVQMYPGGLKYATELTDTVSWNDAVKTGKDAIWGANWRTPTQEEMELTFAMNEGGTIHKEQSVEHTKDKNGIDGFKFTGTTLAYTKNTLFYPETNTKDYCVQIWASTEFNGDMGKVFTLTDYYGSGMIFGYFLQGAKTTKHHVILIVNE